MMHLRRLSALRAARLSALAVLVLVVAAGGVAYAVIPRAGGLISGCYKNQSGQLRVIDPAADSCLPSESSIQWNQAGQVGPVGPAGPPGPSGATGPRGPSDVIWAAAADNTRIELMPSAEPTTLLHVDLSPGMYLVSAKGSFFNADSKLSAIDCALVVGGPVFGYAVDRDVVALTASIGDQVGDATVVLMQPAQVQENGNAELRCLNNGGFPTSNIQARWLRIVATKVGTITEQ
jgi:hypothetical protein